MSENKLEPGTEPRAPKAAVKKGARGGGLPAQVTVTRVGTSAGIILPKAVLQQLHVEKGQKLYATEAAGGSIRLSRFDPDFERQMKHALEAMDLYPDALKELAK
jgi:putative addiction module antidote